MEYNRPSAQSDKRPLVDWMDHRIDRGRFIPNAQPGQKERAAAANLIIAIWMIRVYTCL